MKHIRKLLSVAVGTAVLVLSVAASAQSANQGFVTVVRIQGEARYSLGDGKWHPLVVGKILGAGSAIQTSHDGMVELILGKEVGMRQAAPSPDRIGFAPDAPVRGLISYKPTAEQNAIRMWRDTLLAIDKLTVSDTGLDTVSDTELNLRQGRIYASVKKLSGASQYFIKIPKGIAGVRGTKFTLSADGTVETLKNTVVLSLVSANGTPVTVVVPEGYRFDPQTGQLTPLPSDVITLLQQIAIATETVYVEVVSFDHDATTVFVSPTTGNPHYHDAEWWPW